MALALEEARAAWAEDEVPIGAVIVGDETLLARAHNRVRAERDPTAHAEILCLRQAATAAGRERLGGCTVYSSVEPCFMCAGALLQARVRRVVWAVRDEKFGGCVSLGRLLDHPGTNHRVEQHEGLLADESRSLLQEFFRTRRGKHEGSS